METAQQKLQASEYRLPYHYFADFNPESVEFTSFKRLSFAVYYSVTAKLVFDSISTMKARSWLDVGCGDGALISGLDRHLPGVEKVGIDYDPRSIEFARLINPQVEFRTQDLGADGISDEPYDFVTLIEVLEHIPPEKSKPFLKGLASTVKDGGYLMLTVPHLNQRIPRKHFRHFEIDRLSAELNSALPEFNIEYIYGFGKKNFLERVVKGVLNTKHAFLEFPALNRMRFSAQLKAIPVSEKCCQQIAVLLKKNGI